MAGAFLLNVLVPNLPEESKTKLSNRFGRMLVSQTQKRSQTRREELELFADVFGDQWFETWSKMLGGDESA